MTDVYRIHVEVTAPVYPTERTDRVADAVANLFPEAELTFREGELAGTTHSLATFSEHLHRQEILDTARTVCFENREGATTSFQLKKQAAAVGRVNFAVGEPDELGEIAVRIRVEEPDFESVIDRVAPPTEDGEPIGPPGG